MPGGHREIVWITAILALIFASFGLILVVSDNSSRTQVTIGGQEISSQNVGIISIFISAVMIIVVFREVLSSTKYLSSSKQGKELPDTADNLSSELNDVGNLSFDKNAPQIAWNEVLACADSLAIELGSSKGFRPDIIIGVCGGGLAFADLVSKRLGHIPVISLWADRHNPGNDSVFSAPGNQYNIIDFDSIFEVNRVRRVLVIDDVSYSGGTLQSAVEFVRENSNRIRSGQIFLKTATLFAMSSGDEMPDFYVLTHDRLRRISPFSDALRQRKL